MKSLAIAIVGVLLFAGTASADHHHKTWNKFFAGSWETGDYQLEMKLVADGDALIGTGSSDAGDKSAWIMGWDPKEHVMIHEWFGKQHGRVAYKVIDENTLRGPAVVNGPEETTKGTVTITRKDDATYTVHWTDVTTNGTASGDFSFDVKKK